MKSFFGVLAACLAGFVAPVAAHAAGPAVPTRLGAVPPKVPAAVPRARCAPGDVPETSFQGDPGAAGGQRCNASLVGQYVGDGSAGLGLAWYGDCAYMSTAYAEQDPQYAARKGTVVIDASDPAHPVERGRLQAAAMIQPHESMKANPARGLLAATVGGALPAGLVPNQTPGAGFAVYDVRSNCTKPELQAEVQLPNGSGHEGEFSPDGMTYFESTILNPPAPAIIAVDLADPKAPRSILQWQSPVDTAYGFHGLQIQPGGRAGFFTAQDGPENGLVIADTSGLQVRAAALTPSVVGKVAWHDSNVTQTPQRATIGGRRYAVVSDEMGTTRDALTDCRQGTAAFGFLHLVDVQDPTRPTVTGTVAMESNDPAHCATLIAEGQSEVLTELAFSSHYCAVDDPDDTTAVACTWFGSGLRVFDIRDPNHPAEIAYYVPAGRPEVTRGDIVKPGVLANPALDYSASPVRWKPTSAGMTLWFAGAQNGFQIVRLDRDAYPLAAAAATPRVCTSRRSVRFALPRGATRVRLTLGGKRATIKREGRAVVVALRGLPRRALLVRLTARVRGRTYKRTTVLHPCTKRGAS